MLQPGVSWKVYLGFAFLCCGAHRCVSASRYCPAPTLDGGYLVPQQDTYSHGAVLFYACENGLKPAVEGWWATATCRDGKWSTRPQCIDINDCIPPALPHAKYTSSSVGWYKNGSPVRVTCDTGYVHRNWDATALCANGTWSSVPVCERSTQACSEPPKIAHAVIINQNPKQDLYASDTEVVYECEEGYNVQGEDVKKSFFCFAGSWTAAPDCVREIKPTPADGGSTTSTGGRRPGSGHGGSDVGGRGSTGGVDRCGATPVVPNGEIVERNQMFLNYQCASFYTRVGPGRVVCHSNGQWSKAPACKAAYCSVDTGEYPQLKHVGVKFINSGEKVRLECVKLDHWLTNHYSVGSCNNEQMTLSRCCNWWDLTWNKC
ncbi:complement factor H-like isoform X2 [Dunckerocampus dactyliophorus]|uniref:complement factor H-like isoform X2 n=1 Tax=Dunckerocampus dactyliophorus TaxID=161453 RepID=UPI0024076BFC|nr:complement factor H-like isoform X2 [Dunckerocampus dactyliophorus]